MQGSWNRDRHKLREPHGGADPDSFANRLAENAYCLTCCPWPLFVLALIAFALWLLLSS